MQQRAGGFGKIRQAGGKALRALLPGRKGSGGRQLEALEDVEESDGVHTDAGVAGSSREGQGWIAGWKSKSRVDLLSGSKKGKGKEKERERDTEGESSTTTPSRRKRLAQATAGAVERVARSGSMRNKADSVRKRGKLPELKLSTSRSRDSSSSRPGSRSQTPDVRHGSAQFFVSSSPSPSYMYGDEVGGPPTPRARAGSTSALTSPSTADLSSDDILDEDDERQLEERDMKERERQLAAAAEEAARAEERVSRRSSLQKFLSFGRQRSSRSSLNEQNKKMAEQSKKGKSRARAGTTGTASGSGSDAAAGGSRTLGKGFGRKSEDNMRLGRFNGLGHRSGPSTATATGGMGHRTGSGPALSGGVGGLAAGASFDNGDGALISGDLTSAMRASSWEGSGGAYPSRDFDVISDCDNQSIAYVDEDTRMIGAGGVWMSPGTVPGSPASLQPNSRSGGSLSAQFPADVLPEPIAPAYGHIIPSYSYPQQRDLLPQPPSIPVLTDTLLHDPANYIVRSTNIFSSPLSRTPVNNEAIVYGEDGHNSSGELGQHVSGQSGEIEEESDSEPEEQAILVRRRRPSESLARSRSRARQENA